MRPRQGKCRNKENPPEAGKCESFNKRAKEARRNIFQYEKAALRVRCLKSLSDTTLLQAGQCEF